MIFTNPINDFYTKAATHAKRAVISELNELEAEIMMLEEMLLKSEKEMPLADYQEWNSKLDELKKIFREKKNNYQ
jgi:hypothetical protein